MGKEITDNDVSALAYTSGFKYRTVKPFIARLPFGPKEKVVSDLGYVIFEPEGTLTINPGWAWDGASSLTVDTKSSFRGSLVHDALYLLMREGHLPLTFRILADKALYEIIRVDGMFKWRARIWYKAVRLGGLDSAIHKRKVKRVP